MHRSITDLSPLSELSYISYCKAVLRFTMNSEWLWQKVRQSRGARHHPVRCTWISIFVLCETNLVEYIMIFIIDIVHIILLRI